MCRSGLSSATAGLGLPHQGPGPHQNSDATGSTDAVKVCHVFLLAPEAKQVRLDRRPEFDVLVLQAWSLVRTPAGWAVPWVRGLGGQAEFSHGPALPDRWHESSSVDQDSHDLAHDLLVEDQARLAEGRSAIIRMMSI